MRTAPPAIVFNRNRGEKRALSTPMAGPLAEYSGKARVRSDSRHAGLVPASMVAHALHMLRVRDDGPRDKPGVTVDGLCLKRLSRGAASTCGVRAETAGHCRPAVLEFRL